MTGFAIGLGIGLMVGGFIGALGIAMLVAASPRWDGRPDRPKDDR